MNHRSSLITLVCIFLIGLISWSVVAQDLTPAGQGTNKDVQADPEMIVPVGTTIPIVLTSFLNSKSTQVGDVFYADTVYPIWIQQRLVIPKGSTIRGTVTEVIRPGKIKGKGKMAIRIDNILLPNGVNRDLVAVFRGLHGPGDEKMDRDKETIEAGGNKAQDAGTILATTTEGAIIGGMIDHGTGAAIGSGAGAAAGIAMMLFTRGRDLVLSPGTQFDLQLKQPLKFAYGEIDFTRAELNSAERFSQKPRGAPQRPSQSRRLGIPGIPRIWP
jgi:hypothetical protein